MHFSMRLRLSMMMFLEYLSTLGPFCPDGLVRTESQSPEPSAKSNLGEIPPALSLQPLFPISSSSSLQAQM